MDIHVIDKFGRSILEYKRRNKIGNNIQVFKHEADHYNIGYKKLRFVGDPETDYDSVNKGYLSTNFVTKQEHEQLVTTTSNLQSKCMTYNRIEPHVELDSTEHWDGKDRIISNVAPGVDPTDVVTMSQIVTKQEHDQLQKITSDIQTTSLCLQQSSESDSKKSWDGKSRVISNVAPGVEPTDVPIMSQVLVYDENKKQFKCGDKYFNIVIDDESHNVICEDLDNPENRSGLKYYKSGLEFKPRYGVYYYNGFLLSHNGFRFGLTSGNEFIETIYDGGNWWRRQNKKSV